MTVYNIEILSGSAILMEVAIINFLLGLWVFYKNRTSLINLAFFIFCWGASMWLSALTLLLTTHKFIFNQFIFFGALLVLTGFVLFTKTFPHNQPLKPRFKLIFIPLLILAVITPLNLFVKDIEFKNGSLQPVNGPAMIFFAFSSVAYLFYGITLLIKNYRLTTGLKRKQIQYVFLGMALFISSTVIFDATLPAFGIFSLNSLGPLASIAFIGFSAYAILKHQLLDIKIVIQKGLIYTILLGAIVFVYLTLIFGLNLVIGDITGIREISALLTIILGIFSVPIIDKYLKKITNPIFFKDTYDYSEAMRDLSEILNKNITVSEIAQKTSDKLKEIFKNRAVEIILLSEKTSSSLSDKLASNEGSEKLRIPILLENKQLAFVALDQKISGDQYTNEDLNLLKTFANQAAVALQKAIFFEQIKTHSDDLEKKVAERTTQIKILQQDQKQMMIDIAHGLQSPLTIIMGHLNFLKKELPHNKDIEIFEYSIDEVSKLIYDLLKLAALEGSIENYSYKPFNLSDALNGLIEYFDVVAQSNDIKLNYDIKPDITIDGDRRQIEESITNIVSNAMKYINNEKDKEISISLTKIDDTVELKIKDTGIGIAAKDLPHIFERFYRVQDEIHKNIRGAGLGLAISKRIIEKFNGTIEAESEVNKGTTFTIKFKLS